MTARELFWKRGIGSYREPDAVAWALGELANRPSTPYLAALAAATPPFNVFEIEDWLQRALREAGEREPPRSESLRDFICVVVQRFLRGELSARDACEQLAEAHGGDFDRGDLQPFWLLQYALQDHEEAGVQFYDERFDGTNLAALMGVEVERLRQRTCEGRGGAV